MKIKYSKYLTQIILFNVCLIYGEQDSTVKIKFKYNYITSPRYSLDGINFKSTRSEFSFRSFNDDFKKIYTEKYPNAPISESEDMHMLANLMGIPIGLFLGIGITPYLHKHGFVSKSTGNYLMLG